MGCDHVAADGMTRKRDFNPRIPYGMRPKPSKTSRPTLLFQSTHPVWDATDLFEALCHQFVISIHASRMGCDVPFNGYELDDLEFQSTHPVWDATWAVTGLGSLFYFNPRIPYGMRLLQTAITGLPIVISIHASRMGCDRFPHRR